MTVRRGDEKNKESNYFLRVRVFVLDVSNGQFWKRTGLFGTSIDPR